MSVGLTYNPNSYAPIATESFFRKFWVPGIKELKLKWLCLFEGIGNDFTQKDIPHIKKELTLFQNWSTINYDAETALFIKERIEQLNEHLERVDWTLNQTVYIG